MAALKVAVSVLQSPQHVFWLPKFGCALLGLEAQPDGHVATTSGEGASDMLSLVLVALDDWQFKVHRCDHQHVGM